MFFSDNAPTAQADIYRAVIKSIITQTADWRRFTAEKYPSDRRNAIAAELLDAIVAEPVDTLPADIVAKLGACRSSLSRIAREVSRRVGFGLFPTSLAEFTEHVLDRVARNNAAINAVFSRGAER
jgi:hypothetical protein